MLSLECIFYSSTIFKKNNNLNTLFPVYSKVETKAQLSWACKPASWVERLLWYLAKNISSGCKWLKFTSVWEKKPTDQIFCISFQAWPFPTGGFKSDDYLSIVLRYLKASYRCLGLNGKFLIVCGAAVNFKYFGYEVL